MRRLLPLVATLVAVDTMLYAALTPLLPRFAHEFGLSKTRAGALVAAYAAGALVGGLPGGLAAVRLGARRAVLVGLTGMGLASVGFALAGSFWTLVAARFVQGMGSAFTWAGAFAWLLAAAPRERRGQLLGSAMGAAIFGALFRPAIGALFGPVIGALAALVGRTPVFCALAGLAVVLGIWTLRLGDAPRGERPSPQAIARAFRNRLYLAGLALMAAASLLFGVLGVLAPLHLAEAGWGAAAIGGVFLVSAALESLQAPLVGRLSDRRGRLLPVRISLAVGAAISLLLAFDARPLVYVPLVVTGSLAYGILFTPAFALIADGAERSGLAQGMAFGFMNAAWAVGAVIGPAAGGAIARATGDWMPFVLSGALCATGLALARRSADERAAVLIDRLPGDTAGVGRK